MKSNQVTGATGWTSVQQASRAGLAAGIAAIPGTIAAHPWDVVKIRQQTTGIRFVPAFKDVVLQNNKFDIRTLFGGIVGGVQQKIVTRGSMFFVSSLCVDYCERITGLDRAAASFVGSALSGYVTGSLAAPFECAKVLNSQRRFSSSAMVTQPWTAKSLIFTSFSQGAAGRISLLQRINGAGVRNAIFDSTFFGVKHQLESKTDLPAWAAYSMAAASAVTIDYAVDVSVKRVMNAPFIVGEHQPGLWSTFKTVIQSGTANTFRGLFPKVLEFSTSYMVTGLCAAPIIAALSIKAVSDDTS